MQVAIKVWAGLDLSFWTLIYPLIDCSIYAKNILLFWLYTLLSFNILQLLREVNDVPVTVWFTTIIEAIMLLLDRDKILLIRPENLQESAWYVKKKGGTLYWTLATRYGKRFTNWSKAWWSNAIKSNSGSHSKLKNRVCEVLRETNRRRKRIRGRWCHQKP